MDFMIGIALFVAAFLFLATIFALGVMGGAAVIAISNLWMPFLIFLLICYLIKLGREWSNRQSRITAPIIARSIPSRNCDVSINGCEQLKMAGNVLSQMKNNDVATLKWTDTHDTIEFIRQNDKYQLGFRSGHNFYDGKIDRKTALKLLGAFQKTDYLSDQFWAFLMGNTP